MKKILTLILCITLVFCMASCGKKADESQKQVSEAETTEKGTTESEIAKVDADSSKEESTKAEVNQDNQDGQSKQDDQSNQDGQKDATEASGSNILVAYFSVTGNTKPLAEYAANHYDADLFEIQAQEPYSDEDIDYTDDSSRSSKEQNDSFARPAIANTVENMDQYDTVILAYPIWWGQAPKIIATFLESYDFAGKTIVPFCTSASSDIGSSADNLHVLTDSSVKWMDGKRFAAGTNEDEIVDWLENVMK